MPSRTVTIYFAGDAQGVKVASGEASAAVTGVGRATEAAGASSAKGWDVIGVGAERGAVRVTESVKGVGSGLLKLGGYAVGAVAVKDIFTQWQQSEQVGARTANVIEHVGQETGLTVQHVTDYSSKVAVADGMNHLLVQSGANVIASMGNIRNVAGHPLFDEAVQSAADFAKVSGRDVPSAARIVALAMSNPEKAARSLRAANIVLTDSETAKLKAWSASGDAIAAQEFVIGKFQAKYSGAAQAMTTDSQRLGSQLEHAAELVGKDFGPALNGLAQIGSKVVGVFDDLPRPIQTTVVAGGLLAAVAYKAVTAWNEWSANAAVRAAAANRGVVASTQQVVAASGEETEAIVSNSAEQVAAIESVTAAAGRQAGAVSGGAAASAGENFGYGTVVTGGAAAGAGVGAGALAGAGGAAVLPVAMVGFGDVSAKAASSVKNFKEQITSTRTESEKLALSLKTAAEAKKLLGSDARTSVQLGGEAMMTAKNSADAILKSGSVQEIGRLRPELIAAGESINDINTAMVRVASSATSMKQLTKDAADDQRIAAEHAYVAWKKVTAGQLELAGSIRTAQQAEQAYQAAQADAAGNGPEIKAQQLAFLSTVQSDRQAITSARAQAVQGEHAYEQAVRSVNDALRSQAQAVRGVSEAQYSLTQAEYSLEQARQTEITDLGKIATLTQAVAQARQDAGRALQQAQFTATGDKLGVSQAKLAMQDAQRAAMMGPQGGGWNPNAQAELNNAYQQARLQYLEAVTAAHNSAQDLTHAQKLGVDKAPGVVSANQALADGYKQVATDSHSVQDASHGVADAQQGVADAMQGVVSASQQVQDAYYNVGQAATTQQGDVKALADAQAKYVSDQAVEVVTLKGIQDTAVKNMNDTRDQLVSAVQKVEQEFDQLGIHGVDAFNVLNTALSLNPALEQLLGITPTNPMVKVGVTTNAGAGTSASGSFPAATPSSAPPIPSDSPSTGGGKHPKSLGGTGGENHYHFNITLPAGTTPEQAFNEFRYKELATREAG